MFLSEDNIRISMFTLVLLTYMIIGAMVFQLLESNSELEIRTNSSYFLHELLLNYNCNISHKEFQQTLYRFLYWNSYNQIKHNDKYKWDFSGSFHFVSSIVTTIGYGNITPKTIIGKTVVIIFGFFGCAGGILFFNLFLERIITFIAFVLRYFYRRRKIQTQERKISIFPNQRHTDELSNSDKDISEWKPSVYWVLFALCIASSSILCLSAGLYSIMENWSFFEALYFAFVSFTTIGFGDYVITANHTLTYKIGNFMIIILGCSCTYSLLNVTSIVIKQFLNCLILRIKHKYCNQSKCPTSKHFWRKKSTFDEFRKHKKRIRRPAIFHISNKTTLNKNLNNFRNSNSSSNSSLSRKSSEIISMKDFLKSNKISLAYMQKQLYETAQSRRNNSQENYQFFHKHNFIPGLVGSLAIVSEKLST